MFVALATALCKKINQQKPYLFMNRLFRFSLGFEALKMEEFEL